MSEYKTEYKTPTKHRRRKTYGGGYGNQMRPKFELRRLTSRPGMSDTVTTEAYKKKFGTPNKLSYAQGASKKPLMKLYLKHDENRDRITKFLAKHMKLVSCDHKKLVYTVDVLRSDGTHYIHTFKVTDLTMVKVFDIVEREEYEFPRYIAEEQGMHDKHIIKHALDTNFFLMFEFNNYRYIIPLFFKRRKLHKLGASGCRLDIERPVTTEDTPWLLMMKAYMKKSYSKRKLDSKLIQYASAIVSLGINAITQSCQIKKYWDAHPDDPMFKYLSDFLDRAGITTAACQDISTYFQKKREHIVAMRNTMGLVEFNDDDLSDDDEFDLMDKVQAAAEKIEDGSAYEELAEMSIKK